MRTLLIGGTHADLGWMLQFIARARKKAKNYDRVIVACEEPLEYLFEDFVDDTFLYPVKKGLRDRWLYKGKAPKIPSDLRGQYPGASIYHMNEKRCKSEKAKYFKYGRDSNEIEDKFDILVHARNLKPVHYDKKVIGTNRNWSTKKWEKFVKGVSWISKPQSIEDIDLSNAIGSEEDIRKTNIASIGSKKGARHIKGTKDLRGHNIRYLCNLMNHAKVIVGESSFPLHLAALCDCPAVVITHSHKEESLGGKTNKDRYKRLWNPYKTDVKVLEDDKWNPPVERVQKAVMRFL